MKQLWALFLVFITNLNYCSERGLLALEVESPQHAQDLAPATRAAKNKKICNPQTATLSACLAGGIVTVVLLLRLSSDSSFTPNDAPSNGTAPGNGSAPIPPQFPPCGTIARSSHSLPMNQTLDNSTVYAQSFEACGTFGGCWRQLGSKFLCPPHNAAIVGDVEQEFVDALVPDCQYMPVYTIMGIKTRVWNRTNPCTNPHWVKANNGEYVTGSKSCCRGMKDTLNFMLPGQPVCNFTTIDPKNILPFNNLLSRNKLERRNRTINPTKTPKSNFHKRKKR